MELFDKCPITIPPEELNFILPNVRKKIFKEIYQGYTKYYGMKLVYAYLNFDADLIVDYCVVYSVRNDDDTADLIAFDVPPIHANRSTPGYRYFRRTKQEKKFFEYGVSEMTIMEKNSFYDFIVQNRGMSLDKNDPAYWKKASNYEDVIQGLLDLSLLYKKKE